MKFRRLYSAIIRKLTNKEKTSQEYIEELRETGCTIGDDVMFYSPKSTTVDPNFRFCVEIGNKVSIAANTTILAHDFSYSVLNNVYNTPLQNFNPTIIGDNVFIGMNATILMGSVIGDNVIIGANSLVHGNIPSNTVWAGNPAKQICTLEEYKIKHEERFERSAINYARQIVRQKKRKPLYDDMKMFVSLFTPRTEENRKYFEMMSLRFSNIGENLWNMPQKYNDIDDFLKRNNIFDK